MTDAGELYGLQLERFVPERTALAKALRREGRREEAERVAKLPKPSVAAWAVNQLVRTQARETKQLFAAGDALARAQQQVIAGQGSAAALREAADRERAAVGELVRRARGLLSGDGQALTAAMLERVSETLHAAALDEEIRAEVSGGCLVRERKHIGLGGAELFSPPAPPAPAPAKPKVDRKAKAALEAAIKQESSAAKAAAEAAAGLEAAHQRRDSAAAALAEAERALSAAAERSERAAAAHRQAADEVSRLSR